MSGIIDAVGSLQEVVAEVSPVPAKFENIAAPMDLKTRLDWGEPALTIIDVRDRKSFNEERIMGAISLPIQELTDRASDVLAVERDIYVLSGAENFHETQAEKTVTFENSIRVSR